MESICQHCGQKLTSSSLHHVTYSVKYLYALCRLLIETETPRRSWISNRCKTNLMPDRIHNTNMIIDDEKPAQPCGHCTLPKCQTRASLMTYFRKKVHHHQVLSRSDRRPAQDIAATVSHSFPLRASAILLGRKLALFQCNQHTDKEHRQASWRFHQKYLTHWFL